MLLLIGILMIIFDLDTLADDTHRRHFIDREKAGFLNQDIAGYSLCKDGFLRRWQPDITSYNAACGDDVPISPTLMCLSKYRQTESVRIWTSRCESLKDETIRWFINKWYVGDYLGIVSDWLYDVLKMRPIGNTEPAHVLKERWLNEYMFCEKCVYPTLQNAVPVNKVDFVFESDPDSIAMFRRYNVYVFDCNQSQISSVG